MLGPRIEGVEESNASADSNTNANVNIADWNTNTNTNTDTNININVNNVQLEDRLLTEENAREQYKRALLELLREVMHPPDFDQARVAGRNAWCIQVNKLLRELKVATTKLSAQKVPPSFIDVDAFLNDAWRFAVTDDVPNFYVKWPRDLAERVVESFRTGVPLRRMMVDCSSADGNEDQEALDGSTWHSRNGDKIGEGGGAAGSAASPLFVSPRRFARNTRNKDKRNAVNRTSTTLSRRNTIAYSDRITNLESEHAFLTSSRTRRFSMQDFTRLATDGTADRPGETSGASHMQTLVPRSAQNDFQDRRHVSTASSEDDPGPLPSTSASPTLERGSSSGRSASVRAWIPQSPLRASSTSPDHTALFSELDNICLTADTLISEAADIDATDEREMRLKDWTCRARKCETNGRKALLHISAAGLGKCDEILYVASTLMLLKAAHIELIEFAESILNSVDEGEGGPREATAALPAAVRDSDPARSVNTVSGNAPHANVDGREALGPSRTPARRRMVPYVLIPSVPWRWVPAKTAPAPLPPPPPDPEPEPEPEPRKSPFLTTSIVIRSKRPGANKHRTIHLQRMSDRQPGDEQHEPACSECVEGGFSCFGKPSVQRSCRRCQRRKKGRCTYARVRGGNLVQVAVGRENRKRKRVVNGRKDKDRTIEDFFGRKGRGKRKKMLSPKMKALRNLRGAGARNDPQGKDAAESESEIENEDESSSASDGDDPSRKRRRSASPVGMHDLEPISHSPSPVRATSEPPDRASRMRSRSRSRWPRFASLARSSNSNVNPHPIQSYEYSVRRESVDFDALPADESYDFGSPASEVRDQQAESDGHIVQEVRPDEELEYVPEQEYEADDVPMIPAPAPPLDKAPSPLTLTTSTSTVPAPASVPISAPQNVILTPTSLPSPSSLPHLLASPIAPPLLRDSPTPLLIASLTAKLDTLNASQAALTAELRGTQAKLDLQARVIEEVRETLRALRGAGEGQVEVNPS